MEMSGTDGSLGIRDERQRSSGGRKAVPGGRLVLRGLSASPLEERGRQRPVCLGLLLLKEEGSCGPPWAGGGRALL